MPRDRVSAVLGMLEPDMVPVEIGADRAPFALGFAARFNRHCFASEVSKGPFASLVSSLSSSPFGALVTPYMADGLKSFPREADTALICGMGGLTIERIFKGGLKDVTWLKTIVIEPQSHQLEARKALLDGGFNPVEEVYVSESTRFYPVIRAVRGEPAKPYDTVELAYGRMAIESRDPLLTAHLERTVKELERFSDGSLNGASKRILDSAREALLRMSKPRE